MQENGLKCRTVRARVKTTKTDNSKSPAPDMLQRNFTVDTPNTKWVSDITYIRSTGGWLYLCAILDLYSRKVVGWNLSKKMVTCQVNCPLFS
ncbi:MAG: hypothetical protein B0D92_04605 [Spirochaeta sp. LUC14_002_19_P3]|nr:MAG: hypothetical protein B0D92_04605 [Spirochaeta sp. LUC14_002_19_P3]